MKRLILACMVALVAAFSGVAPVSASSAGSTAPVFLVHGIPGVPVDVYVDGTRAVAGFQPGTVTTTPTPVPSGARRITIYPAGANPATTPSVINQTVGLLAGVETTLVAHLTPNAQPTLTPYIEQLTFVAPENHGRLVVRHTAALGPVDVYVNGKRVIAGLTNPRNAGLNLPAGAYAVAVTSAGGSLESAPLKGDVTVTAGQKRVLYAVGNPSAAPPTLGLLQQTFPIRLIFVRQH